MIDWNPATLASVLGALGIGGILTKLIEGAVKNLTTRGRDRRDEVDRAWRGRDWEATKRRIAEEYASRQTRRLIDAPCVDTATIEPFPTYPSKETA